MERIETASFMGMLLSPGQTQLHLKACTKRGSEVALGNSSGEMETSTLENTLRESEMGMVCMNGGMGINGLDLISTTPSME
jgi:hypothetical protein